MSQSSGRLPDRIGNFLRAIDLLRRRTHDRDRMGDRDLGVPALRDGKPGGALQVRGNEQPSHAPYDSTPSFGTLDC